MGKLFGTDGVRGLANIELTPELAFNLGRAGAYVITKHSDKTPKIILGMDTRISGDMLESALIAGMTSVGVGVVQAGIIPTPAISYLTRKYSYSAGVMISASHNPFEDNGIKFFDSKGLKLKDEIEDEIEAYILNGMAGIPRYSKEKIGTKEIAEDALTDYIEFLKSTVSENIVPESIISESAASDGEPENHSETQHKLSGLKIALDCANGATYRSAPIVFFEMGAEVLVMGNEPNGININENCGSTHIDALVAFVKETGADIGFAFDGDGDRLISIDENGNVVDGDQFLSIVGNHMLQNNMLKNDSIVVTVMSNLGLSIMCKERGINLEITKVGDRYVLERMLEKGYCLGGEQSGHIIFLDYICSGDGVLSALQLAAILKQSGKPLSELNQYMEIYPQVLINAKIPTQNKYKYLENEVITEAIAKCEKHFEGRGRVLIRPSGTEPLVRVMIEGKDIDEITNYAQEIADLLEQNLG